MLTISNKVIPLSLEEMSYYFEYRKSVLRETNEKFKGRIYWIRQGAYYKEYVIDVYQTYILLITGPKDRVFYESLKESNIEIIDIIKANEHKDFFVHGTPFEYYKEYLRNANNKKGD